MMAVLSCFWWVILIGLKNDIFIQGTKSRPNQTMAVKNATHTGAHFVWIKNFLSHKRVATEFKKIKREKRESWSESKESYAGEHTYEEKVGETEIISKCCPGPCTFDERYEYTDNTIMYAPREEYWRELGRTLCEKRKEGFPCKCQNRKKTFYYNCVSGNGGSWQNPKSRGSYCRNGCIKKESNYLSASKNGMLQDPISLELFPNPGPDELKHNHCGSIDGFYSCYSDKQKCDCKLDCSSSGRDEKKCDVPKTHEISISRDGTEMHNPYYGNVRMGGYPVCGNNWDTNDAKVVCRELGFKISENDTKLIQAFQRSAFGKEVDIFEFPEVQCKGYENKLIECIPKGTYSCSRLQKAKHPSFLVDCEGSAGVLCLSTKVTITSKAQRYGNVYISKSDGGGSWPVCDNKWDINDAQVVCNMIFMDKKEYMTGNVPVWEATRGSEFGQTDTEDFIMDNIECTGSEARLVDCDFKTHDESTRVSCTHSQAAGVRCAKCTPTHLIGIVNLVNGNTIILAKQTLDVAYKKLMTDCYPWDCSLSLPRHEEYCLVKSFLLEGKEIVKKSFQKGNYISHKDHIGELLKHHFNRENSETLLMKIGDLRDRGDDFRKELGTYYKTMATYDEERAKIDRDGEMKSYEDKKKSIVDATNKVLDTFSVLFKKALEVLEAKRVNKILKLITNIFTSIAKVAVACLDGDYSGAAQAAMDGQQGLMDDIGGIMDIDDKIERMKWLKDEFLPRLRELSKKWAAIAEKNSKTYKIINKLFASDSWADFSLDDSKEFLDHYKTLEPIIDAGDLGEYNEMMRQIVEKTCDVIEGKRREISHKSSIQQHHRQKIQIFFQIGVLVNRPYSKEECPNAKKVVERLKSILDDFREKQNNVIEAMANLARAKLSINAAEKLSRVLPTPSKVLVKEAIYKKNAQVLHKIHKTSLIKRACDRLKYINFGEEEAICKTLRENTSGDLGSLISKITISHDKDFICDQNLVSEDYYNIPAMHRQTNESLPDGTLDLTSLLDPSEKVGSTIFQIPNVEWLVQNGWIEKEEINSGPFYVKRLRLISLPSQYARSVKIKTKFSLLSNIFGEEEYKYDTAIYADHEYREKYPCSNNDIRNNPYNRMNCEERKICQIDRPTNPEPFRFPYPSLLSRWKVEYKKSKKKKMAMPFPTGEFRLKVGAEICYRRKNQGKKKHRSSEGFVQRQEIDQCCTRTGHYADDEGECHTCQNGKPRLNGYYCESCPVGYEPFGSEIRSYGCTKCPVDKYKSQEGNTPCMQCPYQQHTDGALGSSICIDKNDHSF